MFLDRTEAGARLATELTEAGVTADLVVGIPRGGLPVARAVADELDVPLDVSAAKKLGAPGNPELAIGAAAADGSSWLNDELIAQFGIRDEYVREEQERAVGTAREKERSYRGTRERLDVAGERVIVVDDGLATGATAIACVRRVLADGADRVILAVPVGSRDGIRRLEREADLVVAVERPTSFGSVGAHYRDFGQVSDDAARSYLER